jgi:hypothetical protein
VFPTILAHILTTLHLLLSQPSLQLIALLMVSGKLLLQELDSPEHAIKLISTFTIGNKPAGLLLILPLFSPLATW